MVVQCHSAERETQSLGQIGGRSRSRQSTSSGRGGYRNACSCVFTSCSLCSSAQDWTRLLWCNAGSSDCSAPTCTHSYNHRLTDFVCAQPTSTQNVHGRSNDANRIFVMSLPNSISAHPPTPSAVCWCSDSTVPVTLRRSGEQLEHMLRVAAYDPQCYLDAARFNTGLGEYADFGGQLVYVREVGSHRG